MKREWGGGVGGQKKYEEKRVKAKKKKRRGRWRSCVCVRSVHD